MLSVPTLLQILAVIGLTLLATAVLIVVLSTMLARARPCQPGVIALIPAQRSNSPMSTGSRT